MGAEASMAWVKRREQGEAAGVPSWKQTLEESGHGGSSVYPSELEAPMGKGFVPVRAMEMAGSESHQAHVRVVSFQVDSLAEGAQEGMF